MDISDTNTAMQDVYIKASDISDMTFQQSFNEEPTITMTVNNPQIVMSRDSDVVTASNITKIEQRLTHIENRLNDISELDLKLKRIL